MKRERKRKTLMLALICIQFPGFLVHALVSLGWDICLQRYKNSTNTYLFLKKSDKTITHSKYN
jgi:hypothetical protein